jgi:hypothetical protein
MSLTIPEAAMMRSRKVTLPAPPTGDKFKFDGDKVRMDLLPLTVLKSVAEVLQWAVEVKGYTEGSWAHVPDGARRYQAAGLRHAEAIQRGEVNDDESGLPHEAHKACCALFELHYALQARLPNEQV